MIYCGFTFMQELDILEIMLREIGSVVDRFVLVEATRTFSGQPKDLHYAKNRYRFLEWWPKIHHIIVPDMPLNCDSWTRERHQRNAIGWGLVGCRADDLVLLCDVDEIVNVNVLKANLPGPAESIRFQLQHYIGYLDCRWADGTSWARIMTYQHLNKLGGPEIAMKESHPDKIIDNSGWHFSYIGGDTAVIPKLKAFSHQEYNKPPYTDPGYFKTMLEEGKDPLGMGYSINIIDTLDELPLCVRGNVAQYQKYFIRPRS